jgi:6-phospho-3-hexuloisomerase
MTCPPVGLGDLLLISAGPGYFSTVVALAGEAKKAGARVVVFTAQVGVASGQQQLWLMPRYCAAS